MAEKDFDPCKTAVLERGKQFSTQAVDPEAIHSLTDVGPTTAVIKAEQRNRVEIETDSTVSGCLVLSDNYYPGWQAFVDGEAVEILRANHTMRAVEVPAGRHTVTFIFAPPILRTSVYVTAAAALVAGLALVALRRRESVRSTTR
jgi:uncharacterized membrane protein YfhO